MTGEMLREIEENLRKAAWLVASAARAGRYNSVLFSSARRHEGTTTTVLGVARQLKEHYGIRPLLVALDRLTPRRARRLGLRLRADEWPRGAGPASGSRLRESDSGISVLLAGMGPGADQEAAATLRSVLTEVGPAFDVILVDTPAVLERACAVEAGAVIPRMILVVEAGRTPYGMLARVKSQLSTANIAIVGTVLNKHKRYTPRWIYQWVTS